jgi:hypothetical protein
MLFKLSIMVCDKEVSKVEGLGKGLFRAGNQISIESDK